jgi:restriction endonuclease
MFRELGCSAEIESEVRGVRGSHSIDVWVIFEVFGQQVKWVVECKLWRRRVTQEKVLALRQVVEDVGADRGILVSDSGFQPGAESVARWTNILLTPSDVLSRLCRETLRAKKIEALDRSVHLLQHRMLDLHEAEGILPLEVVDTAPVVDENDYRWNFGQLSIVDMGLHRALSGRFPVALPRPASDGGIKRTSDLDEYFAAASTAVAAVEGWLEAAERLVETAKQRTGATQDPGGKP